jgi:hypothetical protein
MCWTPNQIVALILGLWLALAPAISAVSAVRMTASMSMLGESQSGHCQDTDGKSSACALMCMNASSFAMTEPCEWRADVVRDQYLPGRHLALSGRVSTPDPPPPKSIALL